MEFMFFRLLRPNSAFLHTLNESIAVPQKRELRMQSVADAVQKLWMQSLERGWGHARRVQVLAGDCRNTGNDLIR